MTRINVIPVTELCDQHLLAEHRELTRIPNGIIRGKLKPSYSDAPTEYTLGTGHVKFFVDKLFWLNLRYSSLSSECEYRGFSVIDKFPAMWAEVDGYTPTPAAIALNRERIKERLQAMTTASLYRPSSMPRWTNRSTPLWAMTCLIA